MANDLQERCCPRHGTGKRKGQNWSEKLAVRRTRPERVREELAQGEQVA